MPNDPPQDDARKGFLSDYLQTRYREVTLSAIIFAIIIGVVMNAAITYAGLKIGFTIGGSAIAAVLGFGVLRGVLRRGTILETNIAQTVASAINTSNSGVIFTVPVLFLIGYQLTITGADFWLITLAAVAGAMLGTAFIIPLRKQMLDIERLRFPSATAVGSILKSPGAGPAKAVVLVIGMLIGAAIYLPTALPSVASPADVEELDALFERGQVSYEDVQRTIDIASWIENESIPAEVRERGELVTQLDDAKAALREARETDGDIDAAGARVESLESQIASLREGSLYSDDLARAAYLASQGERDWADVREPALGWAADPWFGYSDLQWRLAAERAEGEEAIDLDGDGEPEEVLTREVDRDRDGRADLILSNTTIDAGRWFGLPDEMQLLFAIAPFALGAGFLTGRPGLFVLAGGILAYFVINPLVSAMGWVPATLPDDQVPGYAFGAFNRPLGIGLLLGGALMGVLASLPAIREAIKSIAAASRIKGGSDELGLKTISVAAIAALVFLYVAADFVGNKPINTVDPVTGISLVGDDAPADQATTRFEGYTLAFASEETLDQWQNWSPDQRQAFMDTENARPGWLSEFHPQVRSVLLAIIGAIWIWFAGIIIAQCTGMTDWSPVSGMALLTVVLVLVLAGSGAVIGAVLIGAALCVAITLAADMMADMKTGYIVGAQPKRQQISELLVVWIGPVVCMLTLMLIAAANMEQVGVAMGPGTPTVAPQAQALQAVITGVQGGEMPYALYGVGAVLGGLLGLGAFSGLGVLVGLSMYLPFMYISTYGLGCLANMGVTKLKGRAWAEDWGVPFSAGLIVGESILALAFNIYVLLAG